MSADADDSPPQEQPQHELRLREHNQGLIAFLTHAPPEPPATCQDPEGWRRGYASARAAMGPLKAPPD